MYKTHRLQMRLSDTDVANLDLARGDLTRSEYLRRLIPKVIPPEVEVEAPIEHGGSQTSRRNPPRRPHGPNHLAVVASGDRHLHRYKRTGDPLRHVKGVAVYTYECDCGATKEE